MYTFNHFELSVYIIYAFPYVSRSSFVTVFLDGVQITIFEFLTFAPSTNTDNLALLVAAEIIDAF